MRHQSSKRRWARPRWWLGGALLACLPIFLGGHELAAVLADSGSPVTTWNTTTTSTPATAPNAPNPAQPSPPSASDSSATAPCTTRLQALQAATTSPISLTRAYASTAGAVLKYEHAHNGATVKSPLDSVPSNESTAVCWFDASGPAFAPDFGHGPDIDRMGEAITKSGVIVPMARGRQGSVAIVRPEDAQ
jgi:hypothetical protein